MFRHKAGQGGKKLETLKVSSSSVPKSVAGAIAAISRNSIQVDLVAIGASAVNQAVKSIAIARGYVAPNGIELICIPSFSQIEVDGLTKTSIHFLVEKR
jgi:stage V sporulation protein S